MNNIEIVQPTEKLLELSKEIFELQLSAFYYQESDDALKEKIEELVKDYKVIDLNTIIYIYKEAQIELEVWPRRKLEKTIGIIEWIIKDRLELIVDKILERIKEKVKGPWSEEFIYLREFTSNLHNEGLEDLIIVLNTRFRESSEDDLKKRIDRALTLINEEDNKRKEKEWISEDWAEIVRDTKDSLVII